MYLIKKIINGYQWIFVIKKCTSFKSVKAHLRNSHNYYLLPFISKALRYNKYLEYIKTNNNNINNNKNMNTLKCKICETIFKKKKM